MTREPLRAMDISVQDRMRVPPAPTSAGTYPHRRAVFAPNARARDSGELPPRRASNQNPLAFTGGSTDNGGSGEHFERCERTPGELAERHIRRTQDTIRRDTELLEVYRHAPMYGLAGGH
jgi:hypothetical protein